MKLLKFSQLAKVDETTHTVGGIATSETPDKTGEIADYKASKKAYQTWSAGFKKTTETSGQEESLGNIRKQHTLEVAGKTIAIDYNDAEKTISLDTTPIDDVMWEQIKKGFYTGFSHGGDYAWRRCAECETDIPQGNNCPSCKKQVYVRYAPILAEVSYVDNGCNPDATFAYVKADGTTEMRKFQGAAMEQLNIPELAKQVVAEMKKNEPKFKKFAGESLPSSAFLVVGNADDAATWSYPVEFSDQKVAKAHVRYALSQKLDKAAADRVDGLAKKHGLDPEKEREGFEKGRVALHNAILKTMAGSLAKNLWTVGDLANIIQTLAWMHQGVVYEEFYEEDLKSKLPDKLQGNIEDLIQTFLAMAEEETAELAAAMTEHKETMLMSTTATMTKAASPELTELKKQADALNAQIAILMKGKSPEGVKDNGEAGDGEPESIDPIKDPKLTGKAAKAETVDIAGMVKAGIEAGLSEIVKALTKAADEDDDHVKGCKCDKCKDDKAEKVTKGVGDRTAASNGAFFVGSAPVTKAQDVTGVVDTPVAITPELMVKARNGDPEAVRALAKSAPPTTAIPTTLQGMFAPR
jgi:hypothetical protein